MLRILRTAAAKKEQCPGKKAKTLLLFLCLKGVRSGHSLLHYDIYAAGHTRRPCTFLTQPAELLAHMVRALTVQKGDSALFDLQVDNDIVQLIQVIMIFLQRNGL